MLTVEWANGAYVVDWPVNVSTADALPAPDELKGLSLAALLDLLSSARPLHEALRAWLRRQPDDDDSNVELAIELIDPHAKVDTSGFMVKRVQRACWAMQSLRARLEQRTGRIDRLGAKAERSGHPIRIYLPYLEGCQDEKLFRVVMGRERWFGVVMGAEGSMARVLKFSAWELERLANKVPIPVALVEKLQLQLSV